MKQIAFITALAMSSSFLMAQTWEPDGTGNIYYTIGNIGIGTPHPEYPLDINGDVNMANNLKIGETTTIGSPDQQFTIGVVHGDGGANPTILKIIPSGVFNAGGGGNNYPNDPGPNLTCTDGVVIPNVLATKDMFSVYKTNNLNQNIGNLNMGHDGTKAFLETEGTGTGGANHPGDLFINSFCQRNVHVFNANTGQPFANGSNKVMSVEGRLNVSSYMQIGNMSATNFVYNNTQLYVYSSPIMPIGIKVRHGGGGEYGVKVVELADYEKGLGVFRGTPLVDGNERFSVRGDGQTVITSNNVNPLQVNDVNNSGIMSFNFSQSAGTNRMWAMNSLFAYSLGIDNAGIGHIGANINAPLDLINFRVGSGNLPQVWIGNQKEVTGPHTDFRLAVDGKLLAKSCYVTLSDWADFVFEPDYQLLSLQEVETFYLTHKRLPEIPSEKDIIENGVDVGEMNKLLLKKVEELTIYIVAQQKQIDELIEKLK
jgi:hypothetical protein